jgi:hypothetical protein
MQHTELHKKKRKKNFFLLALIFGWCLFIYFLSMVKMANASGMPDKFKEQRTEHQKNVEKTWDQYNDDGKAYLKEQNTRLEQMEKQSKAHQQNIEKIWDEHNSQGEKHQQNIEKTWSEFDQDGKEHQEQIDQALHDWWYGDKMSEQAKEIQELKTK